jgi:formate-dependent nitrite reductase membrane component NrfD
VPETAVLTEPSYYDIPILKQPVWKWQIASYFFFGGASAGAYAVGRIAELSGGESQRATSRAASYAAVTALVPCPFLLIDDLGDPRRFHHMLRVWKPSTPMNLGTWTMVAHSGMVGFEVLRQYSASRGGTLMRWSAHRLIRTLHDAAGLPLSLMFAGYTGVLLSCTANPLWCRNPWLGPLFSASAIATGASATSLMLDLTGSGSADESQHALHHVDTAAHVAELLCLNGFARCAQEKADPLRRGNLVKYSAVAVGGVLAAELLKRIPAPAEYRKPLRIAASILGLAAGFSLRWVMVMGGHQAAADPHLNRVASRQSETAARQQGSSL